MNFIFDQVQDFRYERKFYLPDMTDEEVEFLIRHHPAAFSEIYQKRSVNNIYFDSVDKRHYLDNKNGLSKRLKIRIRWYGDLFGYIENPVLEFKVKQNFHIGKLTYPLAPFTLDAAVTLESIQGIFNQSNLPMWVVNYLKGFEFSLLNRYCRKYFLSADKNYRLTKDTDLEVFGLSSYGNSFLHQRKEEGVIIVELKYHHAQETQAQRVTSHFPFRVSRSSKYVSGLEHLEL